MHSGAGVPVTSHDNSNNEPSTPSISFSGLIIFGPTVNITNRNKIFKKNFSYLLVTFNNDSFVSILPTLFFRTAL